MPNDRLPFTDPVDFSESDDEERVELDSTTDFGQAFVHATDWTTETIISQLRRGNIVLNPRFQRRDAWNIPRKSRFIESLISGLPIPQIVLADKKDERGKFIVLDGKQRLLALLHFWGLGEGKKNNYRLSGLEIRSDLRRKSYTDLEEDPALQEDLNSLLNQTIRTVVIRNWPSIDFLHVVFLRLNTGSVRLSPQELRQALMPGLYTDWIDEQAAASMELQALLHLSEPDYRMRDVEILARSFAFKFYLSEYTGRMKSFLDSSFESLNKRWPDLDDTGSESYREATESMKDFDEAVAALRQIFGDDAVARKPGVRSFNRAIFDFLILYAQDPAIRSAMLEQPEKVRSAYTKVMNDREFVSAVERDTAGMPNTALRMQGWGEALKDALGDNIPVPTLSRGADGQDRLSFPSK